MTIHWKAWCMGLALALALAGGAAPAGADKYSLLIGINDYLPKGDDLGDLKGCENDVRSMRKILSQQQFPADLAHQRVLLSTRATGAAILNGLRWLANTTRPEDTVVVYYSGHGTFFPDERSPVKDEPADGYDEAICPTDCDTEGVLVDDDIRSALALIKAQNVTVIFDSCHSGTATRLIGDRRASEPLALAGVRNRMRMFDQTRIKRFNPRLRRAPGARAAQAGQQKRVDDAPSDRIVFLGGCQPWELSSDNGPEITDNGKPYRGGMFTSLLYLAMQDLGVDASWRNLMREVRRRAAILEPLQEPYAEGPIDRAPFTTSRGTAGKKGGAEEPVPEVGLRIVVGVLKDGAVELESEDVRKFRSEVEQNVREAARGVVFRSEDEENAVEMGILQKPEGYRVWVPVYDGLNFRDVETFREAIQHIARGVSFLSGLRRAAALHNPAGPFQVRLAVEGGPSAVVKQSGEVSGSFVVTQECTAQVVRMDPHGKVTLLGEARRCLPGETYRFRYTAADTQGKELIKVIASRKPIDWPKVTEVEIPFTFLAQQIGSDATQWAEDQETLYVGSWTRLYEE